MGCVRRPSVRRWRTIAQPTNRHATAPPRRWQAFFRGLACQSRIRGSHRLDHTVSRDEPHVFRDRPGGDAGQMHSKSSGPKTGGLFNGFFFEAETAARLHPYFGRCFRMKSRSSAQRISKLTSTVVPSCFSRVTVSELERPNFASTLNLPSAVVQVRHFRKSLMSAADGLVDGALMGRSLG